MEFNNKTMLIKINKKNNSDNGSDNGSEISHNSGNINNSYELLKLLKNIQLKIEIDNKIILSKIDSLENRIKNIEEKCTSKFDETIENLVELKVDTLNITEIDFLTAIKYKDYRSIIHIFRLVYKNKNNLNYVYPFKISGKRSFEYYANKKWNPDTYGHHSMNTIINNIQDCFMKHNDMDNPNIDNNDFFLYQDFILKLSNEKYRKDIFKHIIEEVRVNNL